MQPFPHHYHVKAAAAGAQPVLVASAGLPELRTDAPPEFGGPGGCWSPETLLLASVADCFVLSFRAVARASRLAWSTLEVDVNGILDRADGVTRFTRFTIEPRLVIDGEAQEPLARSVLDKAKRSCLVTNSLNGEATLVPHVQVIGLPVAG